MKSGGIVHSLDRSPDDMKTLQLLGFCIGDFLTANIITDSNDTNNNHTDDTKEKDSEGKKDDRGKEDNMNVEEEKNEKEDMVSEEK